MKQDGKYEAQELNEAFKKNVVRAFIEKKEALLSDFHEAQERKLEQTATGDSDNQHFDSKTDETLSEADFLNSNMDALEQDIVRLKEIPLPESSPEIRFGSLVRTDRALVLIGAAQNTVEVDGREVTGVSTDSPFFHAVESKKSGDTAEINGRVHKIQAVL